MNYHGMMDGWHGDENECNEHYGTCNDCDDIFYSACDEEYDKWRDDN
jgi:hypothetical protein